MPKYEVANKFRAVDLERVLTEANMEKEMPTLLENHLFFFCEISSNFGEKRKVLS
jgi:hypothetical protein